jgi:hypothetical protein
VQPRIIRASRSELAIHPAAVSADNEITLTCENLRDVIGCQLGATQRNTGIAAQVVGLATTWCDKVIYGNSIDSDVTDAY